MEILLENAEGQAESRGGAGTFDPKPERFIPQELTIRPACRVVCLLQEFINMNDTQDSIYTHVYGADTAGMY